MSEAQPGPSEVLDIAVHSRVLEAAAVPVWIYDSRSACNFWGNSAARALFPPCSFNACQLDPAEQWLPQQLRDFKAINSQIRDDVEVGGKEVEFTVRSDQPFPGIFATSAGLQHHSELTAVYKPLEVMVDGTRRCMTLIQISKQQPMEEPARSRDASLRLVEMCNNSPIFQFLFDEEGHLLVANNCAMQNLVERIGHRDSYTLQQYLSIGEFEGRVPEDIYREAMQAIFQDGKPCHRFPQMRRSRRTEGKSRWVLYEMWPLRDPATNKRAVLVSEQNISEGKALEEEFKRRNQQLEAHLQEALVKRDPVHKPAIDIDTPADKTLKLLDKIMRGQEVSAAEALDLRDAIVAAGDMRQPVKFNEQLIGQSQSKLDLEVGESLIQLLSSRKTTTTVQPAEDWHTDSPQQQHQQRPLQQPLQQLQQEQVSLASPSGPRSPGPRPSSPTGVHEFLQLARFVPEEIATVLAHVDDWQFDAFTLSEVSGGRPLSMLSFHLFQRFDLIHKFSISEAKLARFLLRVEEGYPNNPYHNRIHAADVLQSLHVLLCRGGLIACGVVDDTALIACLLSAIIHDYQHKGVNNDYLIRVSDNLAILYNDRSPMENHHLAATFQLMNLEEYSFLSSLPHKVKETLRKLVIEMVLATDMKQHFAIHSMFQSKLGLNAAPRPSANTSSPHNSEALAMRGFDDDMKTLAIQLALKCADLGHLSSPRVVHKKWVQYLEEEFFRQGDREKRNQLSVSPLMDRDKNGISKSQVGFFDIVALPLFQSFAQAFPDSSPMLEAVKDNYAMWREESMLFSGSGSERHSRRAD